MLIAWPVDRNTVYHGDVSSEVQSRSGVAAAVTKIYSSDTDLLNNEYYPRYIRKITIYLRSYHRQMVQMNISQTRYE
jgi:hypothetical protein